MTEQKISILPFDLLCPALTRCGGFLRTFGFDNGADEQPTIKYFVCSNRDSDQTPCPCNPMVSKYGDSKCKGCGEIIEKVINIIYIYEQHLRITI